MKMRRTVLTVAAVAAVMAVNAAEKPLRIAQIDLARQMEPLSVLSNWVDRCQSYGYNAIQLYVEGRIGTKSFSLPKGECYPVGEMAELVKYATDKGLTVIPCVGLLGHADLFFKYPGNEEMDETREGNPRLGKGHDAFCISHPKTRTFLRQYVAEVAAIFPGPYFNAGLDEAWNAGVCSLCAPKEKKDELFLETVLFCHEIITAAGKRMWMWDDFFDFHPKALAKTPRDIVMCHWNYNTHVSSRGSRGHFAGCLRVDFLAECARMGFETIPACWYRSGNAEALHTYANRYPTMGFMATQWEEMQACFPGGSLPRLAAIGLMLTDPQTYPVRDPYPDAVRKVLPSLSEAEVMAAVTLYHQDTRGLAGSLGYYEAGFPTDGGPAGIELALQILKASALRPCAGEVPADEFSERGVLDDLVCRGEAAVVADRLARVAGTFTDPRRTPADIRSAKAAIRPLVPVLERLAARRTAQMDAWRPGCSPRSAASGPEAALKLVKELLERPETSAPANEKRLEVVLVLPDYFGMPKWEAFGKFGSEWRKLAGGIWKPGKNDWAAFSKFFTFTSETMPGEIRLEHHGYGRAQLAFVAVEDAKTRIVPKKVLSVTGDVEHAERLLADDYEWADFGTCGFLEKFFDAAKEAKISSVTLEMSK